LRYASGCRWTTAAKTSLTRRSATSDFDCSYERSFIAGAPEQPFRILLQFLRNVPSHRKFDVHPIGGDIMKKFGLIIAAVGALVVAAAAPSIASAQTVVIKRGGHHHHHGWHGSRAQVHHDRGWHRGHRHGNKVVIIKKSRHHHHRY
jgi:hypothetical protein